MYLYVRNIFVEYFLKIFSDNLIDAIRYKTYFNIKILLFWSILTRFIDKLVI